MIFNSLHLFVVSAFSGFCLLKCLYVCPKCAFYTLCVFVIYVLHLSCLVCIYLFSMCLICGQYFCHKWNAQFNYLLLLGFFMHMFQISLSSTLKIYILYIKFCCLSLPCFEIPTTSPTLPRMMIPTGTIVYGINRKHEIFLIINYEIR